MWGRLRSNMDVVFAVIVIIVSAVYLARPVLFLGIPKPPPLPPNRVEGCLWSRVGVAPMDPTCGGCLPPCVIQRCNVPSQTPTPFLGKLWCCPAGTQGDTMTDPKRFMCKPN